MLKNYNKTVLQYFNVVKQNTNIGSPNFCEDWGPNLVAAWLALLIK